MVDAGHDCRLFLFDLDRSTLDDDGLEHGGDRTDRVGVAPVKGIPRYGAGCDDDKERRLTRKEGHGEVGVGPGWKERLEAGGFRNKVDGERALVPILKLAEELGETFRGGLRDEVVDVEFV